jgi:hypothetical protein
VSRLFLVKIISRKRSGLKLLESTTKNPAWNVIVHKIRKMKML